MGKKAQKWKSEAARVSDELRRLDVAYGDAAKEVNGLQERVRLLEGQIAAFKPEQERLRQLEVAAPVVNALRASWSGAGTKLQVDKFFAALVDACEKAWGPPSAALRAVSKKAARKRGS